MRNCVQLDFKDDSQKDVYWLHMRRISNECVRSLAQDKMYEQAAAAHPRMKMNDLNAHKFVESLKLSEMCMPLMSVGGKPTKQYRCVCGRVRDLFIAKKR